MAATCRADQLGSLLRPAALVAARQKLASGEISMDELRAAEDAAILDALKMQRMAGVDVFVDGEYRRFSFMTSFTEALDGFVPAPPNAHPMAWRGGSGEPDRSTNAQVVGAKLRLKHRIAETEASFLAAHAPGPFKITLPSPLLFAQVGYRTEISQAAYGSRGELMRELAGFLHGEIAALIAEGTPYIQIDAPGYTHFADPALREAYRSAGVDPDVALDEAVAADNACIAGIEGEGVALAVHLCRGNSRGRWLAEGSYEPIAERLFAGLNFQRFLLEYDSDRAGGFEPLRFLPKDKTVVLGLVSTKSPQMETQESLLRRIDQAAAYVPMERLALSPQCGFASSIPGNPLSQDDQQRKLSLVAEVARKAWG